MISEKKVKNFPALSGSDRAFIFTHIITTNRLSVFTRTGLEIVFYISQ